MYEYSQLYLGEIVISVHPILMTLGFLLALVLGIMLGKRKGLSPAGLGLYGVLAAALGLFLGRCIYCAVRWDMVFLNAMGEFSGPLSFFDLNAGSVSVVGIFAGLLLAAPLAARLTKASAARYLDAAAMPALAFYCYARFFEPMSGQGYGDLMGMLVSVCWMEAALTLAVLVCIFFLGKKVRRPGTLAQYALALWCTVQIFPESLRCDEALYVFVFARVTHLGLAVTLGVMLIRLLIQGAKRGLATKVIVTEAIIFAAGIGLCIATIFALDKTNLPKLLVYAVMLFSIILLGGLLCRRIRQEDLQ